MNNNRYVYVINYPVVEKELCFLEMRSIFNKEPEDKILFSDIRFNPSNSVFIKGRLDILYVTDKFEGIVGKLKEQPIKLEEFKIEIIRPLQGKIRFKEKTEYFNKIGDYLLGEPNIKSPKIIMGLGIYKDKWIFGTYKKNNNIWSTHERKPYSYSNSLSVRVARSLVNIVSNGDNTKKIIDPCCGVGTTIVEGLSMGYNIIGSEINKKNIINGNKNLEYFGFKPLIKYQDINQIQEKYDSSIIDIPYGLFSHITKEQQQGIINSARRISANMILITFEDLESMVKNSGFVIIDKCEVTKGYFKRYIYLCF